MTLENRLNKLKKDWNITKNRFIKRYSYIKQNFINTKYF